MKKKKKKKWACSSEQPRLILIDKHIKWKKQTLQSQHAYACFRFSHTQVYQIEWLANEPTNSSVTSIKRFRFWAIRAFSNDEIWDLSHFHHVFFFGVRCQKLQFFLSNFWRWLCFWMLRFFFIVTQIFCNWMHNFSIVSCTKLWPNFERSSILLLVAVKNVFYILIITCMKCKARFMVVCFFIVVVVRLSESSFIGIAHWVNVCVMNQ